MEDLTHRIRVDPGVAPEALLGACAIWLDGTVEGQVAGGWEWLVEPLGDRQLEIRPRHPGSALDRERLALELYTLILGLYRMGLDGDLEGPWRDFMPCLRHCERPPLKWRPLYQDQLPSLQRTPEIELEVLVELHRRLPGASLTDLQKHYELRPWGNGSSSFFVRHPCGVEVLVRSGEAGAESYSYCHLAPTCGRGRLRWQILTARTWGEAWIGHFAGAHCRLPQGLAILPDEIALVLGDDTVRYCILDRSTLSDLHTLTFPSGPSPLYDGPGWLALAQACGSTQKFELAMACCDQALESEPQALLERERWRSWRDFLACPPPPEPTIKVPVRPLAELVRRTGASVLEEIARECHDEVAQAHDERRRPFRLSPRSGPDWQLAYTGVTGAELLKAGVTASALARLGYDCNPIPPPEIFADLFSLQCGPHLIWGKVDSVAFLLQSDPSRIYRG